MDDNKELVRRIAATFAGYHPHKDGWEAYIDEAEDVLSIIQPELDKRDIALNPRRWTREMSDAWHKNIPDVNAAFEALRDTALKTTTGHDNNTEKRGKR